MTGSLPTFVKQRKREALEKRTPLLDYYKDGGTENNGFFFFCASIFRGAPLSETWAEEGGGRTKSGEGGRGSYKGREESKKEGCI
jgi:hypothetical protein